jgi:hypothetical protein
MKMSRFSLVFQVGALLLIATLGVDLVRIWPSDGVVHPDFALRIGFNHWF